MGRPRKNGIALQPRRYQKNYDSFIKFQALVNAGERIEYHGLNFVAMDRQTYDDLKRLAEQRIKFIDES